VTAALSDHASWPRRIGALFIDWLVATLITIGFVGPGEYFEVGSGASNWVLLVFAGVTTVLTGLAGGSFGQLLLGIRVRRLDGQPLGLLGALVRTVLICLVIPPLVFKPESGRGLHDIWTGSAAYRQRAA
jgi:uncharacterized RDD family membrane protein YckC